MRLYCLLLYISKNLNKYSWDILYAGNAIQHYMNVIVTLKSLLFDQQKQCSQFSRIYMLFRNTPLNIYWFSAIRRLHMLPKFERVTRSGTHTSIHRVKNLYRIVCWFRTMRTQHMLSPRSPERAYRTFCGEHAVNDFHTLISVHTIQDPWNSANSSKWRVKIHIRLFTESHTHDISRYADSAIYGNSICSPR